MKVFDCEYVGCKILEDSLHKLPHTQRLDFVTKNCMEMANYKPKKARIELETEKISILLYETLESGSNLMHQLVKGRVKLLKLFQS